MLVIKTVSGGEIRLPLDDIESMTEVDRATGTEREPPRHPYFHREGVNRCAACWRPRAHPAHTERAVLT